jgi:hypothetical protein
MPIFYFLMTNIKISEFKKCDFVNKFIKEM